MVNKKISVIMFIAYILCFAGGTQLSDRLFLGLGLILLGIAMLLYKWKIEDAYVATGEGDEDGS